MNIAPNVRITGKHSILENIPKKLPGQKLTILDMPEMIAVETRFITNLVDIVDKTVPVHHLQSSTMPKTFASRGTCTVIETTATGTNTDAPYPQRDRAMQTIEIAKDIRAVSIQCDMDYDLLFEAPECKENAPTDQQFEKERFMAFVKQKTREFFNGKQECLLCGEIEKTAKGIQLHMALHWGPTALCECCGEQIEHALRLPDHGCAARRERKRRLLCPCPRCGISVSTEQELYEHLEDHTKLCAYQCVRCHRNFTNVDKLQRHQLANLLCFRRAHRERTPYAPRMLPVNCKRRSQQCKICKRRYRNSSRYAQHLTICVKRFLRKKSKPLVNGFSGN